MSSIITASDLPNIPEEQRDGIADAVNAFIERTTGRVWGETSSGSEKHDLASVIFLNNCDIIDVTGASVCGNDLEATDYTWSPTGRVSIGRREYGFRPRYNAVEIEYTYGITDVPADLKQAAIALANDFYGYAESGQKEVTSEAVGSLRYTYATGKNSAVGGVYFGVIDSYRKPNL